MQEKCIHDAHPCGQGGCGYWWVWSYSTLVCLQDRALDYLTSCIDQVNEFNDILQLVIVELVYKVRVIQEARLGESARQLG